MPTEPSPTQIGGNDPTARGVRLVALVEAAKGAVVLLAGFGILSLVHENVQAVAEELVRHAHLNPASRYPRIFIQLAGDLTAGRLWLLAALALAYAGLRLAEGYGLWRQRRWAEWLSVASGAIYMPFEIYELAEGVTALKLATFAVNLLVVAYMGWVLWLSRRHQPA
jgi:uncharacterized membrane protein (DUF2068 family)